MLRFLVERGLIACVFQNFHERSMNVYHSNITIIFSSKASRCVGIRESEFSGNNFSYTGSFHKGFSLIRVRARVITLGFVFLDSVYTSLKTKTSPSAQPMRGLP